MTAFLSILTAVVNSLWQALAVAVVVWLVLRFAKRINAATRYAIWWATLAVVLVLPIAPRLISLMRMRPAPTATAAIKAPQTFTPAPLIVEPVVVTVPQDRTVVWPIAVAAIWAAILFWRVYQIGRSYLYLRGVKHRADVSPVSLPAISRRADLLISRDIMSPMAVGFLRPAIILPESLVPELSEPERDHVLLHESAHLAKYDDWINLAMRVLGGVLALHPVAIWILRRIEREREMACDDWVVARTGSARPYAASLARLVELRQAARREMLASGFFGPGSKIGDRIELLLRGGRTFSSRASTRDVIVSAAVLTGLVLAGSLVPHWIAFAQEQPRPSFEVASVKPTPASRNGDDYGSYFRTLPGGRFSAENVSLPMLVARAYGIDRNQISAGNWLKSDDRYDIDAKANDREAGFRTADASGPAAKQTLQRLMLQTLLKNRFRLAVHRETKDSSGYALVVAKSGPKLKEPTETRPDDGSISVARGLLIGQKAPLSMLTAQLTRSLGRTVADDTGLEGSFDFKLQWTPDETPADPGEAPSLFTAIQEQLGLRLEARKEQREVLVIDHAEKPDAN